LIKPWEFPVMSFWFWNDTLKDEDIIRQIADLEVHGVYGFVIPNAIFRFQGRILYGDMQNPVQKNLRDKIQQWQSVLQI